MSKKFTVESNIDALINMEIGKRMLETGKKVKKIDIITEIANYSNVGIDNIQMVKRGVVTPSLPVALKIAEYFNSKVEDVFKIVE